MGSHALLSNIIINSASIRGLLQNRILIALQQPNFNKKSDAKDKLKELNVPEAPKKPLSSYFRFLSDRRPLLKEQHPTWTPVDITKQCGVDWKDMDPIVRHKYEEAYHKELETYYEKHQKFTSLLSPEQAAALKKAKQEKQVDKNKRIVKKLQRKADKPKRPTSNFAYFVKEKMEIPENKDKKFVDIIRTYNEEWKKLTDEQKEKYNRLHKEDKVRYMNEMDKWESKMIEAGKADIIRKDSQVLTAKTTKVNLDTKPTKLEHDKGKKVSKANVNQ